MINLITLVAFLACFLLYAFIGSNYFFKLIKQKSEKTFKFTDFLDFHLVIILLSALSFFCKNETKDAIDNWVILIPMSYAKFFNFLLIDKLVNAMNIEKIDILTNSFIMTFIFFIYDIIVFIISDLIDCDSDYLILFQFIFSFIYYIFFALSIRIYKNKRKNNEL